MNKKAASKTKKSKEPQIALDAQDDAWIPAAITAFANNSAAVKKLDAALTGGRKELIECAEKLAEADRQLLAALAPLAKEDPYILVTLETSLRDVTNLITSGKNASADRILRQAAYSAECFVKIIEQAFGDS